MRPDIFIVLWLLATPALAQDRMLEVNDGVLLSEFGIDADLADDLDVLDTAGRKIGEVEEVVGWSRDAAEALVVEFEDAFPEYGLDERVLPLAAFRFDGGAVVLRDNTDVQAMPVWRD